MTANMKAAAGERFNAKDRMLHRLLYRVRPAWLAAKAKHFLGVRRKTIATDFGRFRLDPVSMMACIGMGQAFEPEMVELFRAVIRPGDTVIDLGANEGFFSVLAASLAGPAGRVVAIEPQLWLGEVIRENARLNNIDIIEIESVAIGDQNGVADFFVNVDTNSGASGFTTLSRSNSHRTTVSTETLESLLDRRGLSTVDFMKVDIEGGEYGAVFGSRRVFETRRIRAFVLELHPRQLRQRGLDETEFAPFFESCGYRRDPACSLWHWRSS